MLGCCPPIIEFLLPGQKFISTLLSDILTILDYTLVSFKKCMPPPLPYFKVNICPFPLPHFALIFFAYL
jgi:hypothetical protein